MEIGLYSAKLNPKMALEMAILSKEVYKSQSAKNAPDNGAILSSLRLRDKKYESVSGISENSAQAIFVEHENFLCMSFRGTDEWADWLDNIDGRKANSEQAMFGDFHRGFHSSCNDVWDFLDKCYQKKRCEDKKENRHRPLFLTGHSLGGAMATVATAKLVLEDRPFAATYTYGQPRVVKRATAQFMSGEVGRKFFRFQNNQDIVTRIPARLMGYSHIGKCLYIDSDKIIHTDPGFWARFLDFVEGAIDNCKNATEKWVGGNNTIEVDSIVGDHNIDKYIEAIENWDFKED